MCEKLNIRIIAASSPQPKGRLERNHGTHQDRLIKRMRRKAIASYEDANQFLENDYLPARNRRFARAAAKPEDYHGRRLTARELREIFRLETERTISNGWVIRHEGRYLQLQPANRGYGPTKSKALVCQWEDGTTEVYYRGERIKFREISEPARRTSQSPAPAARVVVVQKAKKDHPWRQGYQNMRPRHSIELRMRTFLSSLAILSTKVLTMTKKFSMVSESIFCLWIRLVRPHETIVSFSLHRKVFFLRALRRYRPVPDTRDYGNCPLSTSAPFDGRWT